MNNKKVYVEEIKETNGKEYIIRDPDMITVGRLGIVEKNETNQSILIRLKFYKDEDKALLREVIKVMTKGFLRESNLFKVNIIVPENTSTIPFTELGYTLEGILVNNSYQNSYIRNEYLFGTDNTRFNQMMEYKLLALEGEFVELKLASPEDAEEFLAYYKDNKEFLKRFEPTRDKDFYTMEGQKSILSESYRNYMNGLAINFGIYLEKKLIGKVQISNLIYGGFRSANLGYSLHKDYEGKGLMQDALKVVIDYAFEDLMLHRLEASTLLDNFRSQKTLELQGFKKVGLNEKYLFINGEWRDHYTFYLIKK